MRVVIYNKVAKLTLNNHLIILLGLPHSSIWSTSRCISALTINLGKSILRNTHVGSSLYLLPRSLSWWERGVIFLLNTLVIWLFFTSDYGYFLNRFTFRRMMLQFLFWHVITHHFYCGSLLTPLNDVSSLSLLWLRCPFARDCSTGNWLSSCIIVSS